MNKKFLASSIIIIFFLIMGFFLINRSSKNFKLENKPANIQYVKLAGQSIKVDLVLTPIEQERGLSGRLGLDDNEGMLFIFSRSDKYNFWMKDMNFPLDIIWISGDMKVIYIKKDARPELYPEAYGPEEDAKYVLEVVSGFSDRNNLRVGDEIKFTY